MKHQKTFETLTHLAPLGALAIALNAIPVDAQVFITIDYPDATSTSVLGISNTQPFGHSRGLLYDVLAGRYTDASGDDHGFWFDGTNYRSLDYPGATGTGATGVNNSGTIVGTYTIGTTSHGFWYQFDDYNPFDVPGASATAVLGINDVNQRVGVWLDAFSVPHGYRWDPDGTFTDINAPGAVFTIPSSINNPGQIAGTYIDFSFQSHGFFWTGSIYVTIDVPGAFDTSANGISNTGIIAGGYTNTLGGPSFGYVLEADGTFRFIDVPGSTSTVWYGVRDADSAAYQVVGDFEEHANIPEGVGFCSNSACNL